MPSDGDAQWEDRHPITRGVGWYLDAANDATTNEI